MIDKATASLVDGASSKPPRIHSSLSGKVPFDNYFDFSKSTLLITSLMCFDAAILCAVDSKTSARATVHSC